MRLQIISDLHTEFHEYAVAFLQLLPTLPDLDFLVIAGDLLSEAQQDPNQVSGIIDYLSQKARHILYVRGNHEYYYSDKQRTESRLWPSNWYVLDNSDVTIEGRHFFGGTMWFPNEDQCNVFYQKSMNDFHKIKDFSNWVYSENLFFTQKARELVRPESIVITHHLPSHRSVAGEFKGSNLNRFFVSNQEKLITDRHPRFWIHGHSHTSCDYKLGDTRVICHPYGYPSENKPEYYGPCLIEV